MGIQIAGGFIAIHEIIGKAEDMDRPRRTEPEPLASNVVVFCIRCMASLTTT